MKNLAFFLLIAVLSIALFACDRSDENQYEIEEGDVGETVLYFYPSFGDDLLTMFEDTYDYFDEMSLRFQLFQFYISDVTLISPEHGEVMVKDVDLVTFKDIFDQSDSQRGIQIPLGEAPAGEYTSIRFGIGVNSQLNATQPADYDLGHPLTTGNYWSWAAGYVFFKIEGNADLDDNGNYSEKLTFHIGRDNYYREVAFDKNFMVVPYGKTPISLRVDLKDALYNEESGEFLNFREVNQDHTTNPDVAEFLANELKDAIQLR